MQVWEGTYSWGPGAGTWSNLMLVVVSVPFPAAWFAFMAFKGCDSQVKEKRPWGGGFFQQVASVAAALQNPQRSVLALKSTSHISFNRIYKGLKRKDLTLGLPGHRPFFPKATSSNSHWSKQDCPSTKDTRSLIETLIKSSWHLKIMCYLLM